MQAVDRLIGSPGWDKREGEYIPSALKFLRDGRWSDADDIEPAREELSPDPNCPICKGDGAVRKTEEERKAGGPAYKKCQCIFPLSPDEGCPYCLGGGIEILERDGKKTGSLCRCRRPGRTE
jgi:hypothetical protein